MIERRGSGRVDKKETKRELKRKEKKGKKKKGKRCEKGFSKRIKFLQRWKNQFYWYSTLPSSFKNEFLFPILLLPSLPNTAAEAADRFLR